MQKYNKNDISKIMKIYKEALDAGNLNEEKTYKLIRSMVEFLNEEYYSNSNSVIDDQSFDRLMEILNRLENTLGIDDPTSPTRTVGGKPSTLFQTVKHPKKMLSLDNVYDIDSLNKFVTGVAKKMDSSTGSLWCMEYKLDGLSLGLEYTNGVLTRALTRGDGVEGDDVTQHAKFIEGIPKKVKPSIKYVRGEVIISKSKFTEINEKRRLHGVPMYANSRNLASGSMRLVDSNKLKGRGLRFVAFESVSSACDNAMDAFIELIHNGFNISLIDCTDDFTEVDGMSSITDMLKDYNDKAMNENLRDELDFDIDGLVIKMIKYSKREQLGETNKFPRWAIAYKFPQEAVRTKLNKVRWQVGRTGRITPIAEFNPVQLNGTTVTQATLHNLDEIKRLNVQMNDYVWVEKGGEIIPKVIKVTKNKSSVDLEIPKECPSCGAKVKIDGPHLTCPNSMCSDKLIQWTEHFLKALDIKHLSVQGITKLCESKRLGHPDALLLDIVNDNTDGLSAVLGNGVVKNIVKSAKECKRDFIASFKAIGMHHDGVSLGNTFAKLILSTIKENLDKGETLVNALNISEEDLLKIKGIGKQQAECFKKCISNDIYITMITHMYNAGFFKIEESKTKENAKTICVTGKTNNSRGTLQKMIEEKGHLFSKSVTKNIDVLVVGENAGSKKKKAEGINEKGGNIKILTEDALLEFLQDKIEL